MKRGDKLKYAVMYGAAKAFALLPFPLLYLTSDLIYLFLYKVMHYRRKVIINNLRTSFPEKSEKETEEIAKEFYRQLADTIVETIKLLHISDKQLNKRIEVRNAELVNRFVAEGKSVIIFLAHFGNWEWTQKMAFHFSDNCHKGFIYKELHDKASDKLFHKVRSRFNCLQLPKTSAVRHIFDLVKSGKPFVIGFISDHRANSDHCNFHVDFLNHSTPVVDAGESIGNKFGCGFTYLDVSKPRRGHYILEFKEIVPQDQNADKPVTAEYFRMLEDSIRREPSLWLWSHRRWLYD